MGITAILGLIPTIIGLINAISGLVKNGAPEFHDVVTAFTGAGVVAAGIKGSANQKKIDDHIGATSKPLDDATKPGH